MYNLNETSVEVTAIFPLGIVEECFLKEAKIAVDKNQKEYLKITFVNPESGAEISLMEFEADTTKPAEEVQKKINSQSKRVKHIISTLVGNITYPPMTSYKAFVTFVASTLTAVIPAKKVVRLLTNYSYNNYVALPAFIPFIEDGAVAVADSKLKITSAHKMEKSADNAANLPQGEGANFLTANPGLTADIF